jgi:hypothetical protein
MIQSIIRDSIYDITEVAMKLPRNVPLSPDHLILLQLLVDVAKARRDVYFPDANEMSDLTNFIYEKYKAILEAGIIPEDGL